jgi:hypothetical protein
VVVRDKRCEMQETGNEILAWLPSPLGDSASGPCDRPNRNQSEHLCMQAITVEMVCEAAKKMHDGSYPEQQQICADKNS